MFLLLILCIIAVILAVFIVVACSVAGSMAVLVFSDVIVCIGFIGLLIYWLIKRKHR